MISTLQAPPVRPTGVRSRRAAFFFLLTQTLFTSVTPTPAAAQAPQLTLEGTGQPLTLPPCVPIDVFAEVRGQGPFTFTWQIDNLPNTVRTNPARLNEPRLRAGRHTLHLKVSNRFGAASREIPFDIQPLDQPNPPTCQNLGDRKIQCTAQGQGASEIRWIWGDGTQTPWQPFCDSTQTAEHRFAAPGTYTVKAQLRRCFERTVRARSTKIDVTTIAPPEIHAFEAQGCRLGFCLFAPNTPIVFAQEFAGTIQTYSYDWDGDGQFEEISANPIPTNAYAKSGIYQPTVRVTAGSLSATKQHAALILIDATPPAAPIREGENPR